MQNLTIKAKCAKPEKNAKDLARDKETITTYKLVAHTKKGFCEPVTCKVYMGRSSSASTVYASIWASTRSNKKHPSGFYASGYGTAGGYGYHKESAAIEDAIGNAGFELYGTPYNHTGEKVDYKKPANISGVGETAIEQALYSIGVFLGFSLRQLYLVKG